MNLSLKYGFPFVRVTLIHKDQFLCFDNFLIDTGSASTIINIEIVIKLGLGPEPLDTIRQIRGVGGTEFVYEKNIERILLGSKKITNFKIQIGDMDYGFDIDGILGLDYLMEAKVILDLESMLLI